MKLQSFIQGMMLGIIIGVLSASASKGKLGRGFVRRVLNLRDSLSEAHNSAKQEVSGKLSELKKGEEREMMERLNERKRINYITSTQENCK